MKIIKQGFAMTMALLFIVSAQPMAAEKSAFGGKEIAGEEKTQKKATPSNAKRAVTEPKEEVKFNTGNHVYSVVSEEDFSEYELGDAFFEKDGSYTINIPEPNPFFPYEVEFTYDGHATRKWFMSPDDSVEIAGHTFYVSAYFDGTVVTQMSLNVGGDTVIAYPEKKEFTDEEAEPMSLLPLETRDLNIDLSAYTPAELTMVSIDEIFTGNELADGDKVIWTRYEDDYTISLPGDKLDLSDDVSRYYYEMIVGDDNQLATNNIRYRVTINATLFEDWITPIVYTQDNEGNRIEREVGRYYYTDLSDSDYKDRKLYIKINSEDEEWKYDNLAYIHLETNDTVFANTKYDYFRVYEGEFASAAEAETGIDITEKLFNMEMTQTDAGYVLEKNEDKWITIVTFDAKGNATGCLSFYLYVTLGRNDVSCSPLLRNEFFDYRDIISTLTTSYRNGIRYVTQILPKGFAVNDIYYFHMTYNKIIDESPFEIIAAYVGQYSSVSEAEKANAADIKNELFDLSESLDSPGYSANFNKGIFFTIFAGTDKTNPEETYYYFVKAEEESEQSDFLDDTRVDFYGLNDRDGNSIYIKQYAPNEDSYSENNYIIMLVDKEIDLTYLSPEFELLGISTLYTAGSDTPEISGKSYHDFSNGAVQYTVVAGNGIDSRNIWLQVIKIGVGNGNLYINSLTDEKANTKTENGIIYSTREMIFDYRHDYIHDILLINTGETAIPSISADLVSDEIELDKYWTLNGEYELPNINKGDSLSWSGDLWNLAKLRIKLKEGIEDEKNVKGTLTIKSGENKLIVLTLTGIVGDPNITTTEIPQAIKYVPYGTIIQNNNKYSWNKVSYRLKSGKLPNGIELKENGELYGVPTEAGDFTFTIYMENSHPSFSSSEKTFTLTIIDNTDENIESATDQGYMLTQRIQNVDLSIDFNQDQTVISEGPYEEFVDVFIDGTKLIRDVEYTAESGSTKITIRSETLKKHNTVGKHTLGLEFRTKGTNLLRRAVQNYEVTAKNQNSNSNNSGSSNNGNSNGGSSSGGSSSGKRRKSDNTTTAATIFYDAKKGYMNEQGIILGEGKDYSKWQQDEVGRKLIYADGTTAGGYVTELPDGTAGEQVIWEQINGLWYVFGASGYAKSGWVYDYQLNCWYCSTAEYGIYSGWYRDPQDNCVYYLEPVTGRIAVGWKYIDDKWYYFNETSSISSWKFNAETGEWIYDKLSTSKPYGSMYNNELTPDGYFVGADGIWDGQNRQ